MTAAILNHEEYGTVGVSATSPNPHPGDGLHELQVVVRWHTITSAFVRTRH